MHPQSYFILFRSLQRNVRKAQQVMILSQESTDVPLALFGSFYPLRVGGDGEDSSLKRGKECTLMLKHSKGQVTSTLQSTKLTSSLPQPGPSSSPSKKKRRKTNKNKEVGATSCLSATPGGGSGTAPQSPHVLLKPHLLFPP